MRRALLWSGALALVGVSLAWWLAHRRLEAMTDDLVARTYVQFGEPPIPARGVDDPLSGSVIERILAVYPTFALEFTAWDTMEEETVFMQCASVREGRSPLSSLPQPCRMIVEDLGDELDAFADASQAGRVGEASLWNELKWWPLARAATAVALQARITLERDADPRGAVLACLGLVDLWRDISHVAALQMASASASLVTRIAPVCAEALRQADPQTQREASERLTRALDQVAPIAAAVRREQMRGELTFVAPRLSPSTLRRLHPAAQRNAVESGLLGPPVHEPWWLEPFVVPPDWRSYTQTMAAIAVQADQVPAAALPAIAKIIDDPELGDLARAAASARWDHHVTTQYHARVLVAQLRDFADGAATRAAVRATDQTGTR